MSIFFQCIKYLVPSQILMNLSILLNLIRKGKVLLQSIFCMKCYKSKYFHITFHLMKCYQNQNLQIYYVIEIIICTIFNTNFSKFIFSIFRLLAQQSVFQF